MSTRIHNLSDFLTLLKGVKQAREGQFMAICPGHPDTKPSLSIKEDDGKILVKCFAGCELVNILKPLGLEPKNLFLDNHRPKPEQKIPKKLVATFSYQDAWGTEQFQIRRFEPKDFQVWHKNKSGEYVLGLGETKPIPYRLPELLQAIKDGKRVYLPEGEGKVDRLVALGLTATTSPFGAGPGKWLPEYNTFFTGAEIVNLADKDKVGQDFTQEKARNLYGVTKNVKVLLLPNLPPKGDVINWLDAGGTPEQLEQLADACPDYEPSNNGVELRRMADVKAEAVSWLWRPFIPKGKVTLEEGDPGIGKSWASLAVATAVTLGKGLPGQETTEPANVLIASAEDGLGDTIRPRLDAMGADVSRIFAIDGAFILDENGFALLESYLERIHPALLIIDPLVAYLGASVDMWRANETRAIMTKLSRLAEQFEVAILAVRHLTKGQMSKSIYRGQGSIDFTAACRSVLLAGNDPENPQKRGLVHIKSNLAPLGPSVGYELREGGFYWTGESTLTAAQILAAESAAGTSELDEAIAFLKDELAEGSLPAKDVYRDAEAVGISKRTLDRAKAQLGVSSQKQSEKGKRGGGVWVWELPDDLHCQKIRGDIPSYTQDGLTLPTLPYRELGNLNQIEAKKEVVTERLGNVNTESALGMPVEKAIELWRSQGAPVIHLGPGENCFDLANLLSQPNVREDHLKAGREWLRKVLKRRGEA